MIRVLWMSDRGYVNCGKFTRPHKGKSRRRCFYRTAMQAAREREEGMRGIHHYRNQPWETRKYIGKSRSELPVRRWLLRV